VPQPADPDFLAGHSYYLLAVINRSAPGAVIAPTDVQDSRHLRLSLSSLETRVALMERLLLIPAFNASPNQFTPKLGAPGTNVTLFGNAFNLQPVSVQFGGAAATIVGSPTSSQIVVAVPNVTAQAVTITVQTAGGTTTSVDTFQIVPPAPTFAASPNQFNPKLGLANTNVTLFGNNFNVSPVKVLFGATAATLVGSPTGTQIVAAVPSMAAGAVTITVQTGGGQVTSTDTFTVT